MMVAPRSIEQLNGVQCFPEHSRKYKTANSYDSTARFETLAVFLKIAATGIRKIEREFTLVKDEAFIITEYYI